MGRSVNKFGRGVPYARMMDGVRDDVCAVSRDFVSSGSVGHEGVADVRVEATASKRRFVGCSRPCSCWTLLFALLGPPLLLDRSYESHPMLNVYSDILHYWSSKVEPCIGAWAEGTSTVHWSS